MVYFFNISYLMILVVTFPWLLWRAFKTGRYREGWKEKLWGYGPLCSAEHQSQRIWLHAVSVGEVNLLVTFLKKLRKTHPEWECLVSVTSRTGMELAKKRFPDLKVFYYPLDFSWAVKNMLKRVNPDAVVLTELEIWPNFIHYARKMGIPVIVINGRLSMRSFRGYRWIYPIIYRVMRSLRLVLTQDRRSTEHFIQLGVKPENIMYLGSMKYDGALSDRENSETRRLSHLWGITPDDTVFLAGSTQAPEERYALDTFCQLMDIYPHLKLILVPRHPERFPEVAQLLKNRGLPWTRRSELRIDNSNSSEIETLQASRILLVDTVGELGAWWGTAHIAYVGGSMTSRGGQNMIEPAAYGATVCFGPNTLNFKDVVENMLEQDAAYVINGAAEMVNFLRWCLEHPEKAGHMGDAAARIVAENQGVTEQTIYKLESVLNEKVAENDSLISSEE